MPKPVNPGGRAPYSTRDKFPSRKVEKRLKMPAPVKRPVRFQIRSIIRHELIRGDKWWFTLHRRGPRQPNVGEDPLEARAVSHDMIRGTLPERILYKALVEQIHLVPDVDFDFQSSLQGGRLETGGIVADFLFQIIKIVIQVQGPTHFEFLRTVKDSEQKQALEDLGYTVYEIFEDEIYDEARLNLWLKKVFNLYHSGGGDNVPDEAFVMNDGLGIEMIWKSVLELRSLM